MPKAKHDTESKSLAVAAFFPGEGYGGFTPCKTMADADAAVESLVQRGFGKRYEIHIVETRTRKWVRQPDAREATDADRRS